MEDYLLENTLHYRQTTNILWIHVLVLSLHIIWHELLLVFQIYYKTLPNGFYPYNIISYVDT